MNIVDAACELLITSSLANEESWSHVCKQGEKEAELYENKNYFFNFRGAVITKVFIDDVELLRSTNSVHYSWAAGFFSGKVELSAIDATGKKHQFFISIRPASEKLAPKAYSIMCEEIRAFDARLLLGHMGATLAFGVGTGNTTFGSLVALARLRLHGENFLKSVSSISHRPHKLLRPVHQQVPLSAIKRLHPTSLVDRRILAIAGGANQEVNSIETIQLLSQVSLPSFDTPANRAMKALLLRFLANVRILIGLVESGKLAQEREEQTLRKHSRLEFLQVIQSKARQLLSNPPFNEVSKSETSSAGLTHIAAHPLYSRAYRQGTAALRSGIEGDGNRDELNISPTWSVYETWCYVHLLYKLQTTLNLKDWQQNVSLAAKAELSFETLLSNGSRLEILFQAKFRSERPSNGKQAWSLSKERYPDILLVLWTMGHPRFLVLDAKYRSGRQNVLDAMESAHIYHDSLRLNDVRPDLCLLLLPGKAEVISLEDLKFQNSYGVGAVSEFSCSQPGIERCLAIIQEWCTPRDI